MNSVHHHPALGLGIDVSSLELWAAAVDESRKVVVRKRASNDEAGCHALADWIQSFSGRPFVVFEATGVYHRLLAKVLANRGIAFRELNPRMARDLAKGLGILHKTDKADAAVLAQAALMLKPDPSVPRSTLHLELRDVSRQILSLTEDRANVRKRLGMPSRADSARQSDRRMVEFFTREINSLERHWKELLKNAPVLLERYRLALTVPHIGHKTARAFVSELPEDLEPYSSKKLCAYSGPAPRDHASGRKNSGAWVPKTGNARLRKALHMISILAIGRDERFKNLYARLKAKGKHHNAAITAVQHKLVRNLIAVLKRKTIWSENPPKLDIA
jgi:transposase